MRSGAVEHMLTQHNASLPQLVAALVVDVFLVVVFLFCFAFLLQRARWEVTVTLSFEPSGYKFAYRGYVHFMYHFI